MPKIEHDTRAALMTKLENANAKQQTYEALHTMYAILCGTYGEVHLRFSESAVQLSGRNAGERTATVDGRLGAQEFRVLLQGATLKLRDAAREAADEALLDFSRVKVPPKEPEDNRKPRKVKLRDG